jgi:hypothetical protein
MSAGNSRRASSSSIARSSGSAASSRISSSTWSSGASHSTGRGVSRGGPSTSKSGRDARVSARTSGLPYDSMKAAAERPLEWYASCASCSSTTTDAARPRASSPATDMPAMPPPTTATSTFIMWKPSRLKIRTLRPITPP